MFERKKSKKAKKKKEKYCFEYYGEFAPGFTGAKRRGDYYFNLFNNAYQLGYTRKENI